MKNIPFIILLLVPFQLVAQTAFTIEGKTNTFSNGKVVLHTAYGELQLFTIKQAAVVVHNHSFIFEGSVKYPSECRIELVADGNHSSSTEPFFIGAGDHKIIIDKNLAPHDALETGLGVNV